MIMRRLSELRRSLYGPEGCRGLTTEGSGADGPDVAGGVVRVAPIDFEAASPRNESQPEMRSNHAGTQNESTLRETCDIRRCTDAGSRLPDSRGRRLRLVESANQGTARVLIEELLLHHPVLRFANSKDRSWRSRQSRRGH